MDRHAPTKRKKRIHQHDERRSRTTENAAGTSQKKGAPRGQKAAKAPKRRTMPTAGKNWPPPPGTEHAARGQQGRENPATDRATQGCQPARDDESNGLAGPQPPRSTGSRSTPRRPKPAIASTRPRISISDRGLARAAAREAWRLLVGCKRISRPHGLPKRIHGACCEKRLPTSR
jgi:hypothetical protein